MQPTAQADKPEQKWSYFFLRTDLPIGQQAIQASHAAFELGRRAEFEGHPSFVFFTAQDREQLAAHQRYAESHGLTTFPFYEPYSDWGLTAFACEPITQEQRALFKDFTLWRK